MLYPSDTGFRISDNPHSISLINRVTSAPTMGDRDLVAQAKYFVARGLQGGFGRVMTYPAAAGTVPTDESKRTGWFNKPPVSIFGTSPLSPNPLAWAGSQYQMPLDDSGMSGLSGDTNDKTAIAIVAGLGVFTLWSFRMWPFSKR